MYNRQQHLRSLEHRVNQLTQEVTHKLNHSNQSNNKEKQRGAGVCLFKPKKHATNNPCPDGWSQAGHSMFGGLELNKGHHPTNFCVYGTNGAPCPDGMKSIGTLGPNGGSICALKGGHCEKLSKKKGYKKYNAIDIADYIGEFTK